MDNRTSLSLVMLIKSVIIVTIPVLLILISEFAFNSISFSSMIYYYIIVFLLTGIIIRQFLTNICDLTNYVNELALDRQVEEPKLSYLRSVIELPQALINLRNSWEKKKKHTANLITEYETLVDSLPDILIMCDSDMKIARTNKAARNIFGQNLASKPLSTIIANDSFINAVASVLEELSGRNIEFNININTPTDFRAIIELFPAASADNISVIITLNDITQIKRIANMQTDFVANASHEIRTPLASIIGFIETLRGPAKDDIAVHDEFLSIMADQAVRMRNLIGDLLSLSKIEMSKNFVPQGSVDIIKIIRSVKESFDWALKEKNMTLRFELQENFPPARGEESELMQVIYNLVGNAIKYGSAGTEVVVVARVTSILPNDSNFVKVNRAICISVIDNGEGIPREHIPRLTERFYRVDSARTRTIGGTGLGLAIVKHIIQHHRGVLSIESIVGEGSTFSFYLHIYTNK
ncbi:MAG: ATP-binding protein [Pseudomonadota bacterium]